mmetsp:Transcript_64290/g.153486  ORF Transcript_64290/g.153486 Transcript_64290/m.153486 type:complete len:288 (-) Transcript_64290:95-958(-)
MAGQHGVPAAGAIHLAASAHIQQFPGQRDQDAAPVLALQLAQLLQVDLQLLLAGLGSLPWTFGLRLLVASALRRVQIEHLLHHGLRIPIDALHHPQHHLPRVLIDLQAVEVLEVLLYSGGLLAGLHVLEGVELHPWGAFGHAELLANHLPQVGATTQHRVVLEEVVGQQREGMLRVLLERLQVALRGLRVGADLLRLLLPALAQESFQVHLQSLQAAQRNLVHHAQRLRLGVNLRFQRLEDCAIESKPCGVLLQAKHLLVNHLHPGMVHGLVMLQQGLLQKPLGMPV